MGEKFKSKHKRNGGISSQKKRDLYVLLFIAIVSILCWNFSYGIYLVYPFSLLATWFHEMGHGLMALLTGGKFLELILYWNGSGVAHYVQDNYYLRALVAAAGPLGAPTVGILLLSVSKTPKGALIVLRILTIAMLISLIFWIRTIFGWFFVGAWILFLGLVIQHSNRKIHKFIAELLAVQAIISAYKNIDYLFSKEVVIDGKAMLSDTGFIAQILILPHWFWAILILVLQIWMIAKVLGLTKK